MKTDTHGDSENIEGTEPATAIRSISSRNLMHEMEAKLAAELPAALSNLLKLANSVTTTSRTYQAAGSVMVERSERDAKGKVRRWKEPAYPEMDPEEMVLVSETTKQHPPDRRVQKYLETVLTRLGEQLDRHKGSG